MLQGISWQPTIGDPTILGWVTVFCYFLASISAFVLYAGLRKPGFTLREQPLKNFWLLIGIALLVLCINKQLDLQTLFTQIGRSMARSQGWYAERHKIQLLFILSIMVIGSLLCFCLLWYFRQIVKQIGLALIGFSFLISFILIRAASFHHMDYLLRSELLGVRFNGVLEIGGILLILTNALVLIRHYYFTASNRHRLKIHPVP